jgi:hypothetical protein
MANNIVLNPQRGDSFALTGVASAYNQANAFAVIGVTVYSTASISAHANNALAGQALTISGFASAGNNGTFLVTASTATTVTTNNGSGVVVVAAGTASFEKQGYLPGYASKIENLMCNQQGDNVTVNPGGSAYFAGSPAEPSGDLLIAVAIGMKSLWPFDQLHGESPDFGYLQGLNDFNANPVITDNSSGTFPTPITEIILQSTSYTVTSVAAGTGVYAGTFTGGGSNGYVGYYFTIAGFVNSQNNGTYICTASTAIALTLTNPNSIAETHAATATANAIEVVTTNALEVGDQVVLAGTQESFLNGTTLQVVVAGGTYFTANYPPSWIGWPVTYTNASDTGTATEAGGNEWTLVTNLNLADSDYTVGATPPAAPGPWPSSKWNLDGYYPSVYIWVCQNAIAGSYKVNLNSMYQNGIDPPQDLAAGKPIFDGGVNFQVFCFSGAALSGAVDSSAIGTSAANPADAGSYINTYAANGDLLFSVGLQKSGNVFSGGDVLAGTGTGSPPYGAPMTVISYGKLVGSEAHYAVEYALTPAGSAGAYNPNWINPLGYEMVVASIAIKSV